MCSSFGVTCCCCFFLKMHRFVIFCPVWLLLPDLICCMESSTDLAGWSLGSVSSPRPPAVTRFSVPEDHHVCLSCGPAGADVVWTLQDRRVLVTRQGGYQTNLDRQRYLLLKDGSFCVLQLDDSDTGQYRCNQRLVAELQVLTGVYYTVSVGRTLLLPCRGSSKPKHRWFLQRVGERRESIFTRFRNGTEKPEWDGSRLSYANDALQIRDLHPEDAGEYFCNGVLQARVIVLADQAAPTRMASTTSTTPASAEMKTDVVEIKNKTKTKPHNALLLVAVVGMGLLIVLMAIVCVLLISMKCKSSKKKCEYAAAQRQEDTELQPWRPSSTQLPLTESGDVESSSLPEETIHYASLGRQNWRRRPSWSPPLQHHQNVIYTSVVTRPAAGNALH